MKSMWSAPKLRRVEEVSPPTRVTSHRKTNKTRQTRQAKMTARAPTSLPPKTRAVVCSPAASGLGGTRRAASDRHDAEVDGFVLLFMSVVCLPRLIICLRVLTLDESADGHVSCEGCAAKGSEPFLFVYFVGLGFTVRRR